jgi:hypothetical protein
MLLNEIVPLIARAIARGAVKPTGSEDVAELTAEAVALAAKSLDSLEHRGKTVPANSIAYYSIESLKRGRRSGYSGSMDAMSAAATVSGRVHIRSMDAAIPVDAEDPDAEMTLHDTLADTGEDVDVAAARKLDWDAVIPQLDARRRTVLQGTAEGRGTGEIAGELKVVASRVCQLRESIAPYIVKAWGSNGLADMTPTAWRASLRAVDEKRVARYARAGK